MMKKASPDDLKLKLDGKNLIISPKNKTQKLAYLLKE